MEITATGFSRSITTVFRGVLKPTGQTEIEYHDARLRYFPKMGIVTMEFQDVYDTYFYRPLQTATLRIAEQIKKIQTGNINVYILYILVTLTLLLLLGDLTMSTILLWIIQLMLIPLLSPFFIGMTRKMKAKLQNRRGASPFQPYRDLIKLFRKDEVISRDASWVFRFTPYLVFAMTVLIGACIPLVSTALTNVFTGDFLVVIYLHRPGHILSGPRRHRYRRRIRRIRFEPGNDGRGLDRGRIAHVAADPGAGQSVRPISPRFQRPSLLFPFTSCRPLSSPLSVFLSPCWPKQAVIPSTIRRPTSS